MSARAAGFRPTVSRRFGRARSRRGSRRGRLAEAEAQERQSGDRGRDHVGREAPLADRLDHAHLDVEQVGAEEERRERERGLGQPRPLTTGERSGQQPEEAQEAERRNR